MSKVVYSKKTIADLRACHIALFFYLKQINIRQVPVNNLSFTAIKYSMLAIKMKRKIKPHHPDPQTLRLLNYCPFP